MRILLTSEFHYDDPTGESSLAGLARAYAGLGHQIGVAARASAPAPFSAAGESMPWGSLWKLGTGRRGSMREKAAAFLQLRKILRGFKPDFIHMHLLRSHHPKNLLTPLWLPSVFSRVPMGLTLHSWDHSTAETPSAQALPWLFLRPALRRARWVAAISDPIVEDIKRAGFAAGNIAVVPSGYDPAEMETPADGAAASARPFILCLARLAPYKGVDVLLMAWRDACAALGGVDLVLCGQDFYGGYFQSMAEKLGVAQRTFFLGRQDRKEVLNLLKNCLYLVLPSRYELLGLAAIEAMACGKAVLATEVGGLKRVVAHESTGLLVPPKDPRALAKAIVRLAQEPGLRDSLGNAGRARAREYRWDRIAERYLNLHSQAAARP
ncbi:MAG TPA: glycosyltransferase family 4 protein [Elusimicrobiota bacterium]|nr:glycosyltransferase family 4 protein [Elusimicrobiota bacterium]